MITEDYVSFNTAKLLKEKGFDDEYTNAFYDKNGNLYFIDILSDFSEHSDNDTDIAASTLYVAMKWLREVHNLFIFISTWLRHKDGTVQYYYEIRNLNDKDFETIAESTITEFDSPEKTCEAAIKYCLENLI